MSLSITSINETAASTLEGSNPNWTGVEKFIFRVSAIFFLALIIPYEPKWYAKLFEVKSFFAFLNTFTGYIARFYTLQTESGRWGTGAFINWGIALLIAIAGALVWTLIARKSKRSNYNEFYYWLRVIVRYRIAVGIIAYGFLKFYPMQMPDPSISNLDTSFGDYNTYKIYWQVVGVSIPYEITLGVVEIIIGTLLLFRQTTAIGAVLVGGVLYNVAHANIAYDGGVHVYSAFFVLLSLFILIPYLPNLYKLLIKHENAQPHYYYPVFTKKWKRTLFYSVKYLFIFAFPVLFGILRYNVHYHAGQLKEPVTPGLQNARGYYNVTEFRLNNKIIPYSPLDSVRWQSVVFEKWSTLVYKVNKPFSISQANGIPNTKDIDRSYELAGIAGGRRFLYYQIDFKHSKLILQDKNRPSLDDDDVVRKGSGVKANNQKFVWSFSRPSASRIILSGLNDYKDSIYVVLDKVWKHYPIRIERNLVQHK